MKRILVCGAGGSPATNFVRSLRKLNEPMFLLGVDSDPYTLQRAETDVRLLVPRAKDPSYIPFLNQIIKEHDIEFVHAQNDAEVEALSEHREELMARTCLPGKETVRVCLDKFESYRKWEAAGLALPKTMLIATEEDLHRAMRELGPRVWLRNVTGAAGNGAYPTDDYEKAKQWIEFQDGWGSFTAAQCLTKDTVTWMSLWDKGTLVAAQGRKRLSWELGNRAPSGVTGVTGTGMTYADAELDTLALKAIAAIDAQPHGVFSVDFTYDANGVPNPTEINIGRFFTTHLFFTEAGLNMPELLVRLAYGEPLPDPVLNPLPNGLLWVRGVDFLPILTEEAAVTAVKEEFEARLKKLT